MDSWWDTKSDAIEYADNLEEIEGPFFQLSEVQRFEKAQIVGLNANLLATPYLDPEHEYYAEELAVAIQTWMKLYDKDGNIKTGRGHKDQIKAALAGRGLSGEAIDRIATLINPKSRKKGGLISIDN